MRFIRTLVFASAVFVESIVCPGFPASSFPRDESVPPEYRTLIVTPAEYPDAYIKDRVDQQLHLVQMPFVAFIKGDIIVGRNFNGRVYPIYNSEGRITLRNMASRTTELITFENSRESGLIQYLSARAGARARARANIHSETRLDDLDGTID